MCCVTAYFPFKSEILVFSVRGKIFSYPARMLSSGMPKIHVIINLGKFIRWSYGLGQCFWFATTRATYHWLKCAYEGSRYWTQVSCTKQINKSFSPSLMGNKWFTWNVWTINSRFICAFLHSNKDYQSLWNNSVYFNAPLSLGLPLAFIYRAFCYRKNASIQVRTSIQYQF